MDFRYLLIIVLSGIVANWLLKNITVLGHGVSVIWGLLFPFILGVLMAYVLNIPMTFFEKKLFHRLPEKLRRPCSFILVLILFILVISFLILIVLPELAQSVVSLTQTIPEKWAQMQKSITGNQELMDYFNTLLADTSLDMNSIKENAMNFIQTNAGNTIQSVFKGAASLVNGTFSLIISFVFMIYVLFDKEHLHRQVKGLSRAYLSDKWYHKLRKLSTLSNDIFRKFITGQCLECLAIGTVFAIILAAAGFKYWLVIASLICILSLIPIFGSFFACVIGAFLILVEQGIWRCIAFLIVFIVVQQLDGNFMYPRIVGNSVGLPSLWVLVAVTLGGSLMGIAGMILFIPVFSIIYVLLRESTLKKLEAKNIPLSDLDLDSSSA